MPYCTIYYADGRYSLLGAATLESSGGRYIPSDVYEAWVAHKKQDEVFQTLLRMYDNEDSREEICERCQEGCKHRKSP